MAHPNDLADNGRFASDYLISFEAARILFAFAKD